MADTDTDATTATRLIKKYLIDTHGPIVDFTFQLISVGRNTHEAVWVVKCRAYTTPKDTAPTEYTIKVNIQTGQIIDVQSNLIK